MKILYTKHRTQIAYMDWADLHPKPMAGYDVLPVGVPWWTYLPIWLWRSKFTRSWTLTFNFYAGRVVVWHGGMR